MPDWRSVNVNFNDSNTAMRNAQAGFTNTADVFSNINREIMQREKQALDEAYRQKALDENIRQFEATHALNRDKFNENVRQFGITSDQDQQRIDETIRHNRASEANAGASVALARAKYNQELQNIAKAQELAQSIVAKGGTANEMQTAWAIGAAQRGIYDIANPYAVIAQVETEAEKLQINRAKEAAEKRKEAVFKSEEILGKAGLTGEANKDVRRFMTILTDMGVPPDIAATESINRAGGYRPEGWLDFQGDGNVLNSPDSINDIVEVYSADPSKLSLNQLSTLYNIVSRYGNNVSMNKLNSLIKDRINERNKVLEDYKKRNAGGNNVDWENVEALQRLMSEN